VQAEQVTYDKRFWLGGAARRRQPELNLFVIGFSVGR
jgi:hypothetical protein